jgi:hypothetical protein
MPITLLDPDSGESVQASFCLKGSEEETMAIIRNGMGSGCSLVIGGLA